MQGDYSPAFHTAVTLGGSVTETLLAKPRAFDLEILLGYRPTPSSLSWVEVNPCSILRSKGTMRLATSSRTAQQTIGDTLSVSTVAGLLNQNRFSPIRLASDPLESNELRLLLTRNATMTPSSGYSLNRLSAKAFRELVVRYPHLASSLQVVEAWLNRKYMLRFEMTKIISWKPETDPINLSSTLNVLVAEGILKRRFSVRAPDRTLAIEGPFESIGMIPAILHSERDQEFSRKEGSVVPIYGEAG